MLKLVLYSFLLMTSTFALTNEEFFKPIDLEKIEKFTPNNKEVLKYGGDHKGFVDEDGDLADDRLEVFFKKNSIDNTNKKSIYRRLFLLRELKKECDGKIDTEYCRILSTSNVSSLSNCREQYKIPRKLLTLVSSLILTDDYKSITLEGSNISLWEKSNTEKLLNINYDCKE